MNYLNLVWSASITLSMMSPVAAAKDNTLSYVDETLEVTAFLDIPGESNTSNTGQIWAIQTRSDMVAKGDYMIAAIEWDACLTFHSTHKVEDCFINAGFTVFWSEATFSRTWYGIITCSYQEQRWCIQRDYVWSETFWGNLPKIDFNWIDWKRLSPFHQNQN